MGSIIRPCPASAPQDTPALISIREAPWFGRLRGLNDGLADLGDANYLEQLVRLYTLEALNRRPGADVRLEAARIATQPSIRAWLAGSDALMDRSSLPGPKELVAKRRLGILRHLTGADRGYPVAVPCSPNPGLDGRGAWVLQLEDEREWYTMSVEMPTPKRPYPLPLKQRLNSVDARAILGWPWYKFERFLRLKPHLVKGRIVLLGTREIQFHTPPFVAWVYELMNT